MILDSARPEWLSCYGWPQPTSPYIDELAAGGYLFENTISPSSWTFPAMASVFTGMLPAKHGGHDEHLLLDTHYPTMPEIFARAGYDTAAFADVPFIGPMTKLDRGFATMSNLRGRQVTLRHKVLKAAGKVHQRLGRGYRKTGETAIVIGEAMHWLRRGWDRSKPFLLYIHSDETHAPFLPPGRFRRQFTDLTASQMYALNQDKQLYMGGVTTMSDQDFEHLRALARAEVAFFDHKLGRLLDWLRREGVLNDTIVVVAADHGENFGEHGLMRHALCLYDTLLRVPLIIRPAGGRQAVRVKPMVQFIDVLPTLMRLASIDEPQTTAEFQGSDLIGRVEGQQYPEFVVSEIYHPPNMAMWEKKVPHFMEEFRRRFDRAFRSIRTETQKYIWSDRGGHELYDLKNDPAESHNLIDQQPGLARELQQKLDAWLASFKQAESVRSPEAMTAHTGDDEQIMARLRDLGYVE